MRKLYILAFCLCFLSQKSIAQPPQVDSLRKLLSTSTDKAKTTELYNLLGVAYMKMGLLDTAYSAFNKSLQNNTGNSIEMAKSLSEIGNILSIQGEQKNALDTLNKAVEYVNKMQSGDGADRIKIRLYRYMGDLYSRSSIHDKSIEFLEQSTSIAKKLGDELAVAKNSSGLAINFAKLADYKKAVFYNNEALRLYETLQDSINIAKTFTNIATLYKEKGDNDSTIKYVSKAEAIYTEQGYMFGMPNLISLKAEVLSDKKQFAEALKEYRKVIDLDNELGLQNNLGYDYQAMGTIFQSINNFDSSNYYIKKSIVFFDLGKMNKELVTSYRTIVDNYTKLHNTDSAAKYFALYNTANENYLNDEKIGSISNAEIRYETSLKEATIDKQNAEIKLQKQRNTWLLVGSIFLLVIAIILALLYRVIKRKNYVIQEKNKIIEGQKAEILHFHSNSLNQLRSMFRRQSENQLLHEQTNEQRVNVLSILHNLLYSEADYNGDLKQYMEQLCKAKEAESGVAIHCDIDVPEKLKNSFIKDIGIITNEILTNSIKHAFGDTATKAIQVEVLKQNGDILLHFTDSGNGLPPDFLMNGNKGFGLGYVNDLVLQHDGEIKYYNRTGANFEIKLAI